MIDWFLSGQQNVARMCIKHRVLSFHTYGYKIGCISHAAILRRYRCVFYKRPVKPKEKASLVITKLATRQDKSTINIVWKMLLSAKILYRLLLCVAVHCRLFYRVDIN